MEVHWGNPNLPELNLENDESDVWLELILFFERPYFSRTWVLQELMFDKGRNNIIFGCGQHECPASDVWNCVQFLQSNRWIRSINERYWVFEGSNGVGPFTNIEFNVIKNLRNWHNVLMHTKIVNRLHFSSPIPLRELIRATAGFETREPRDKILALLSMTHISELSAYGIKVDYSQPVEELYRDVTGRLTVGDQSYHLLGLSQELSNKRIQRLPSWVPDYSVPPLGMEVGDSMGAAADHLSASAGSITWSQGSANLGVKARILDEIEVVAETGGPGLQARHVLAWLQMLAKYLEVDIKIVLYRLLDDWKEGDLEIGDPVDQSIYHVLRIVLDNAAGIPRCVCHFADFLFGDSKIIWSNVVTGWEDMMQLANTNMARGFLGQATYFQDHAKTLTTNVHGRRFFITKSGRAGLGPVLISKGDVLAQFDSRHELNSLRPNGSGHYSLLDGPLFNSGLNAPFIKQGRSSTASPEWQSIVLD